MGGSSGAGKNNRGQKNGSEGVGRSRAVLGWKKCQSGGREGGRGKGSLGKETRGGRVTGS